MKKILISALFTFSSLALLGSEIPQFPGGDAALKQYIEKNTRYPETAKENGVEGIVVVGFSVLTDGSLDNIKVTKLIDPDLEREAIRIVKGMPAWIPAEINGTPIEAPSYVNIPFILE